VGRGGRVDHEGAGVADIRQVREERRFETSFTPAS
jgi:hypothetical protein